MCLRRLIYNKKFPAAFICYKRDDDFEFPNLIREHLNNRGYYAFLNHQDIIPAVNYDVYLEESIKNSANFILVITKGTFLEINEPKDYVCKEIRLALKYKTKIIPVINLEKSGSLPEEAFLPHDIQELIKIQYIEYQHNRPDEALRDIRKNLRKKRLIISRILFILFLSVLTYLVLTIFVPEFSLKNLQTKIDQFHYRNDSIVIQEPTSNPLAEPGMSGDINPTDDIDGFIPIPSSDHKTQINRFLNETRLDRLLRESMNYRRTYLSSKILGIEFEKALNGFKILSDSLNEKKLLNDSAKFYYDMASKQFDRNYSENALENYFRTIKYAIPDFK